MDEIKRYKQACWQNYKEKIGLPKNYTYLYGNPVKVHVPVETATDGFMLVGAYPTAHFNTIDGIPDVPVGDHLFPFSSEKYFDGSRVRSVDSGEELEEHYLKELDWPRNKCWITDLVKVFLFKDGHVERYKKLGYNHIQANRQQFMEFAQKSIPFLEDEIELAQPKTILLLGTEVTATVLSCSDEKAMKLMAPEAVVKEVNGIERHFFPLPHPGIVMRNSDGAKRWSDKLKKEILPHIKSFLN